MANDKQVLMKRVLQHGRYYNHLANHIEQEKNNQYWWTTNDICTILQDPRYSSLQWRYLRTPELRSFQKIIKQIPITTVLNYTKALMRPIYTDFTECSENRDFSRISAKFYYYLFLHESIYVSYDLFSKAVVVQSDKRAKKDPRLEVIKKKKFDLWLKMTDDEYDENLEFMHIDTGIIVKVPQWRENMAHVRWGADFQNNFVNWFNIAVMELMLTHFLEQCIRLVGTRIEFITNTDSKTAMENLTAMLDTFNTYIHQNFSDVTDIKPLELIKGTDLAALKDTIYYYLDRMKYEYGRVSNTNPKGERLTSGENYKDISSIANRQKETLEQMIEFSYQAKEMWNIELEFAVSGIPEKEAIFTVSHMAQNPNMEKEYFGQVEGTQDRVPRGQPTPKSRSRQRVNRYKG